MYSTGLCSLLKWFFLKQSDNFEFPWLANMGGCGASVIAPDWMLTAAHCVTNQDKQYKFCLGSTHLHFCTRKVKSAAVFIHEGTEVARAK